MSHKSGHQLFCYLDCGYNTKSGSQSWRWSSRGRWVKSDSAIPLIFTSAVTQDRNEHLQHRRSCRATQPPIGTGSGEPLGS